MNKEKPNILIVDDNPGNLRFLASILSKKGYAVRPTLGGEAALLAMEKRLPELILLDIMMPGMSGYELCERIKADEKTRDIPVIFISAMDDLFDKVKAFSMGGVDYITKPFKEEEVLARVETHLAICLLQKELMEKNRRLESEIAERERIGKRLLESEAEKEAILNGITANISFINRDFKILWTNRTATKLLKRTLDEIIGQNCFTLWSEHGKPCDNCPVFKALKSGKPEQSRIDSIDGRIWDVRAEPVMASDEKPMGIVVVSLEITERIRIEEMMIQTEKMISVGGLAAGLAHEINNPLAGMVQNAQVLLGRLSKETAANQRIAKECGISMDAMDAFMEKRGIRRMLESIRESGKRAAGIVDGMISFSSRTEHRKIPVDLSELMDRTVELACTDYDLRAQYGFHRIGFIREYEKGLPKVACEAAMIEQVILNLLKNGAEAFGEKGEGKEAPQFILRTGLEGKMAVIEVEDNGPGMEEEVRKRVFDPFFTTKGVARGVGLGLSLSCFIITWDHGGSITVESKPGRGSKFIVRFPLD